MLRTADNDNAALASAPFSLWNDIYLLAILTSRCDRRPRRPHLRRASV